MNINTGRTNDANLERRRPVTAQRIIDYRNQIGRFDNVDQLLEVNWHRRENAGEIPSQVCAR